MKTIRTTAIRTENTRSRNHEKALHRFERKGAAGGSNSGTGAGVRVGLSFSCIPDLLRHYRRLGAPIGCCYGSKRAKAGSGTAPLASAASWKAARLKDDPLAF